MIDKIISGGQTGADRAALDWALAAGVPHGGFCPRGRRAEDGVIPGRYNLTETESADYAVRTRKNVEAADATVIFSLAEALTGGSLLTLNLAREAGKPVLHLAGKAAGLHVERLKAFLKEHRVHTLNVAGPRRSGAPGISDVVQATLQGALF